MKDNKSKNKMSPLTADVEQTNIGYGKPPVATRFQKGKSGNPRGRPKGSKNFADAVAKVMNRKVIVRAGGKLKRLDTLDAVLMRLRELALKGEGWAIRKILDMAAPARTGQQSKEEWPPPGGKYKFTLDIGDKVINEDIVDDPAAIEEFMKKKW